MGRSGCFQALYRAPRRAAYRTRAAQACCCGNQLTIWTKLKIEPRPRRRARSRPRRRVATPGRLRAVVSHAAVRDHPSQSVAINKVISRPSEVLRGNRRPSEVIRGPQRPSEVIKGHQGPSEAIRGHQRSSEAIRGHQRPSTHLHFLQPPSARHRMRDEANPLNRWDAGPRRRAAARRRRYQRRRGRRYCRTRSSRRSSCSRHGFRQPGLGYVLCTHPNPAERVDLFRAASEALGRLSG